jgi:CRP-like cAMP-binding protein
MIPFLTKRTLKAGHVLFRRGDRATCLFLLSRGSVRLPEIDVLVREEGAMIGEIGLFAPAHERTTSAICETDVVALVLTEDKVLQLYYQDPKFGFSLIQLVIRRLLGRSSRSGRGRAGRGPVSRQERADPGHVAGVPLIASFRGCAPRRPCRCHPAR